MNSDTTFWRFGHNQTGGTTYYNGLMDELIIFNRTLSDAEIKALYDGI
ncbi:Uncharacterised protein [uncultured archaeon]|nr:Uncharacterised protein [uncultured archaeon]